MTNHHDDLEIEHYSAIGGINQLLPHLHFAKWEPIELSEDDWKTLERELERPLSAPLRKSTAHAIGYFVHSLRLKDKIPTPRQYADQLQHRIAEVIDTADNLLSQITPLSAPARKTTAISPKKARQLLGGREATWNEAARAAQTTQADDEVMAVADHVRLLVASNFPEVFSSAQISLLKLVRTLHDLKLRIAEVPHNKAGPDGDYELNLLLTDLLRVARAAGDKELKLASHDVRDEVMRDTVKRNPAYRFVEGVIQMISASSEILAGGLGLSGGDRAQLVTRIKDNVDRRPGTLIDKLDAARALILGTPVG